MGVETKRIAEWEFFMSGVKRRVIDGARNTLRENGIYEPAFRAWAGGKARARSLRHIDELAIEAYLAQTDEPRLAIVDAFAGEHAGWLCAAANPKVRDVVCLRSGIQLPSPDAAFGVIYIEHSLELRSVARGELLLRECYRLLKPGGLLRVSTMNLAFVLDLLRTSDDERIGQYMKYCHETFPEYVAEPRAEYLVNSLFRDYGHKFLYSEAMVHDVLAVAGFTGVTTRSADTSSREDLQHLHHGRDIRSDILEVEGLFVEATRPPAS